MLNYSAFEDTVLNVARKISLLTMMATFFIFIYFSMMTIQLSLAPPEVPSKPELTDIVWTDPEQYLFDTYEEEYTLTDSEPHSDSDVKTIIDGLTLPEQHSEISMLIVGFLIKHPDFDVSTADMVEIQAKVEEYAEWVESMLEEYDDVEHYRTGLLQWVKDFTSEPEFYNFAYSLSLHDEELEFGELEDAVDDAIITYSVEYDEALYFDDDGYEDELYEHQEAVDISLNRMRNAFTVFGAFLVLILLFRIEEKLAVKAS